MLVLRIFWTIISFLLTILLIAKFILFASIGNVVDILPAIIGILLCFYLLFTLEGCQVAGLLIKDLDSDAIEQFLHDRPVANLKDIFPIYKIFSSNFDGFVVGRQLFVIMTVVTIAFLNKSISIEPTTANALQPPLKGLIVFFESGFFAFVSSTLIPSWISQLLPQFLADGRAITFLALPGTRLVLWISMLLDRIQLGQPAHALEHLLKRLGVVGEREPLPAGKQTFFEASLNFFGRAKKQHEISFILGCPTTVRESITYVFKRGNTRHFDHSIQLTAPVVDDIELGLELPEGVFGEIEAKDSYKGGIFTYWINIKLNQSLPRQGVESDKAVLNIEYQTTAYTDDIGISQATEFISTLPTEGATVTIESSKWLLRQPKVSILEVAGKLSKVPDNDAQRGWEIHHNRNKADILLHHPTVATVYRIEFENMGVPFETQTESNSQVERNQI